MSESSLKRYLVFRSDHLDYGLDIRYVTEIIINPPVTPLPLMPSYITGIINLRGQIIPIVNIRLFMGKEAIRGSDDCVVILNIDNIMLGIQTDNVSEVFDVDESAISPIPAGSRHMLVSHIMTLEDRKTILLFDCARLVRENPEASVC